MVEPSVTHQLAQIVIRGVAAGKTVEIDGLGSFLPDPVLGLRFEPSARPQVFIAYVKEDAAQAERLYEELAAAGFSPWMDVRRLLPGQSWPRAIESAIETSGFFLACFSANSVNKKGGFQAEIRYALECARRVPLDDIFVVPIRLDNCRIPRSIQKELEYVDLFPAWAPGVQRLVAMMRKEVARRRGVA